MKEANIQEHLSSLWAVILAAGRGTRMNATLKNKVAYEVKGIPMITRTISNLRKVGIENIVVVVGFAKESVISLLDNSVKIAEQKEQLGTGDAVREALREIPSDAQHVLAMNGDDSFLFSNELFEKLCELHVKEKPAVTFLSVTVEDPKGLGRILRNEKGEVVKIVEEKDASDKQREIKEINAACYLFDASFLKESIDKIEKSSVTGEYYIVSLVDYAVRHGKKVEALHLKDFVWRGVNTNEELEEAQKLV